MLMWSTPPYLLASTLYLIDKQIIKKLNGGVIEQHYGALFIVILYYI